MNQCILGLDPGLSGAFAFYFTDYPTRVSAHDMPVVNNVVDSANLADAIARMKPDYAVIELVGSMPGQGLSSTFKFGRAFGTAIGIISGLRIPHRLVTPQMWKRHFALSSDKERSRALALQTFTDTPEHFSLKKHEGRAEAALLALYGAHITAAMRDAA